MKILKYTCLLVLAFATNTLQAQQKSYSWFTDSNGLPQNSIKTIIQDKYGFIWLLTESGLVRYDGDDFKIYNADNIAGITSNRMNHARGNNNKDSIFIYNNKNETILLNHLNVLKIISKDIIPDKYKYSDGIDSKGQNNIDFQILNNLDLSNQKFYCEIRLSSKNYYLINNSTINLYNNKKQLLLKKKHHYSFKNLFLMNNDSLYILTKNNQYYNSIDVSKKKHSLNLNPTDKTKVYWSPISKQNFISSGKNLYQVERKDKKISLKLILENFDFDGNNICSIHYDSIEDIIYLGSLTKGLCIIKKQPFKSNLSSIKNNDEVYYAQTPFSSNKTLTANGTIFSKKGFEGNIDLSIAPNKYNILIDKNGDIWKKDLHTLYRFLKRTNYKTYLKTDLKNNITQLYLDNNDIIWFSVQINDNLRSIYYVKTDSKSNLITPTLIANTKYSITSFLKDGKNSLWLGCTKGLLKMNLSNKKIIKINGLKNSYVRSLYKSSNDKLWITTYENGFFLYQNNKVTQFPLDKKNYLKTSHCIVEDSQDFFWISTNKGLFQVNKKALLEYSQDNTRPIYYHYYDKTSGFLSNEFNGGGYPCGLFLKNGDISLPTLNGMLIFNSKEIIPKTPTNKIYLDEVKVDNKIIPSLDTITLNRNFSRITLTYVSPYFGNNYNLNIEAKLDDEKTQGWIKLNRDKSISFTTLNPGKYRLITRKLSGFNSKYDYKVTTLIVQPALWQTWWFKLFLIIAVVFLFIKGIKLRTKYLKRQNILLEDKISEKTTQLRNTISELLLTKNELNLEVSNHKKLIGFITHDIKTPMKYLTVTSENLYENFDKKNINIKEILKKIYTSSYQISTYIENLLIYSKTSSLNENATATEVYNFKGFIDEKIKIFIPIAASKKIRIINKTSKDVFITINKQLLAIIIHNILDNAVKNTNNGIIDIKSFVKNNKIYIVINDTGVGMNNKQLEYYKSIKNSLDYNKKDKQGYGYYIILELLAILNGKIVIRSKEGEGTCVELIFDHTI
ncbi:ligand-binding sensor domain-containing protein [Flavobacterium collinsii]|uniref:histidine kinase n=1 Tax=Flavobacterium collinsii TaxID=1114861 RepID=A0ABM8KLH8_9FLAO|nr:HAMP domain-containing sensor histidine kinase [Flavobacterium collinsii]CAA9200442.1 Adaptive-response sensory-kinase SasA [Flavobacterium collinsii]